MNCPPGADRARDRATASVSHQGQFGCQFRNKFLGRGWSGPDDCAVIGGLHTNIGDAIANQPVDRARAGRELCPVSLWTDANTTSDIFGDDCLEQAVAAIVLDPERHAVFDSTLSRIVRVDLKNWIAFLAQQ